jgi:hypothetical protein
MSTYYPQRLASIQHISGVGKVKLERYGSDFLLVICSYCNSHSLKEKKNTARTRKSQSN